MGRRRAGAARRRAPLCPVRATGGMGTGNRRAMRGRLRAHRTPVDVR